MNTKENIRAIWRKIHKMVKDSKGHIQIADQWLQFEPFYEWYRENEYPIQGKLSLTNRFIDQYYYGPKTCILVPRQIANCPFIKIDSKERVSGVSKNKEGMYEVKSDGELITVTVSKEGAIRESLEIKNELFFDIVFKYEDEIPKNVWDILMNFNMTKVYKNPKLWNE